MFFADIPWWNWPIAMVAAAVLVRVHQMGKEIDILHSRVNWLTSEDNTPIPSDGTPDAEAIKKVKALYKAAGKKFTWATAKQVVRSEKKAKGENDSGTTDKRTA